MRKQNPTRRQNQGSTPTKADLADVLDNIEDLADDALDPELSREDVVARVKQIYGLAAGDEPGDDTDDDDSDED